MPAAVAVQETVTGDTVKQRQVRLGAGHVDVDDAHFRRELGTADHVCIACGMLRLFAMALTGRDPFRCPTIAPLVAPSVMGQV